MADAKAKPKKTSDLVVRIVLIVVLVIVAIMAIGNYRLRREYSKALDLYNQVPPKYQEAHDILESLVKKPLAIMKIRGQARKTLGQCKFQLAVNIGQNAHSKEGWTQAVTMLEEARELAGPTEAIEMRIKEYREYIEKSGEQVKPEAAPAAAPPAE